MAKTDIACVSQDDIQTWCQGNRFEDSEGHLSVDWLAGDDGPASQARHSEQGDQ